MEVRPGYKQTGVGVIPDDWKITTVEKIVEDGRLPSGIYKDKRLYGRGAQIIKLGDVFNSDNFDPNSALRVELSNSEVNAYRVRVGDIFIALASVKLEGVGKVMLVTELVEETAYDHNVALIRLIGQVDPRYVFYLFRSNVVRKLVATSATQVGTTFLKASTIREFSLPLPPTKNEQRAIAAALSDVDALLDGLERLIAKKRDLKQAAMQQLLTGQTRLPAFSGDWELKAIQDIGHVGRGRVISHIEIAKSSSPDYPVYSSQTSNNGVMGYLDTYEFEGDYVTWTTDGANAGTVFARTGRFNCTNVCGTIKLHNSDHRFIAAVLGQSTQPHVSRHLGNPKLMNDVMKKIEILIPKLIEEQTAIATILSDMDAELAALEARCDKTRALKQGMMQELLTGKTRLL